MSLLYILKRLWAKTGRYSKTRHELGFFYGTVAPVSSSEHDDQRMIRFFSGETAERHRHECLGWRYA